MSAYTKRPSSGVWGPYRHGRKWRIYVRDQANKRTASDYLTEQDALTARNTLLEAAGKLADVKLPEIITVLNAIQMYVDSLQGTCNPTTVRARERTLRYWLGDCYAITDVTSEHLLAKLEERQAVRAVATMRLELIMLKTFFKWAHLEAQIVPADPSQHHQLKARGVAQKGKTRLRTGEAVRLADWCFAQPVGRADLVLACLLLGLRSSEVVSRVARDVDVIGQDVHLWIDHGKTRNAERRVFVPAKFAARLLKLREGKAPGDQLFGEATSRQLVSKQCYEACRAAGVPPMRAHALRATWATLAREVGQATRAVADTLGHGGTAVTHQHYILAGADQSAKTRQVCQQLEAASVSGGNRKVSNPLPGDENDCGSGI